jgi:hypothetical protein
MSDIHKDIICHVLAQDCTEQLIYLMLDKYVPNRHPLNLDYAAHLDGGVFKSESEMLRHFVVRDHKGQFFYWRSEGKPPDNLMCGAHITSDKKLVMSLTLDGTEARADEFLTALKSDLKSDVGVISHSIPAPYETGRDFELKYSESLAP